MQSSIIKSINRIDQKNQLSTPSDLPALSNLPEPLTPQSDSPELSNPHLALLSNLPFIGTATFFVENLRQVIEAIETNHLDQPVAHFQPFH